VGNLVTCDSVPLVNEDPEDVKFMVLLGLFTRLRQICLSSKLLTINDESTSQYKKVSKKKDTEEIVEFNNHKYEEIIKLTDEMKSKNEKVIIFSSFTSYLKLVHDEMNISKDVSTIILATDSQQERKEKLDNWRTNKNNFVLLLNFKTGAEGLNLTEANNIILCDTWWIYSVENQAISRVYRNGQEKIVNVFRLVMKNSIEEIIYTKSQLKKNLFEKFKNNEEIEEVKINTNILLSMLNEV
jgi:SNF2 family DNA or RNA helicase